MSNICTSIAWDEMVLYAWDDKICIIYSSTNPQSITMYVRTSVNNLLSTCGTSYRLLLQNELLNICTNHLYGSFHTAHVCLWLISYLKVF